MVKGTNYRQNARRLHFIDWGARQKNDLYILLHQSKPRTFGSMELSHYNSLEELTAAFPTEESCLSYLEHLRWDGFVTSPFDPVSRVYLCKGGRYRCRNTGKYFNARTGTLFYNTRVPLQKWFMALWLIEHDGPITSVALGQKLGLTQKTAWFMLSRIKRYLDIYPFDRPVKKPMVATADPAQDRMQMLDWLQNFKK